MNCSSVRVHRKYSLRILFIHFIITFFASWLWSSNQSFLHSTIRYSYMCFYWNQNWKQNFEHNSVRQQNLLSLYHLLCVHIIAYKSIFFFESCFRSEIFKEQIFTNRIHSLPLCVMTNLTFKTELCYEYPCSRLSCNRTRLNILFYILK